MYLIYVGFIYEDFKAQVLSYSQNYIPAPDYLKSNACKAQGQVSKGQEKQGFQIS